MTFRVQLRGYDVRDASTHHLVKKAIAPSHLVLMDGMRYFGIPFNRVIEDCPSPLIDIAFNQEGDVIRGNPRQWHNESVEFTTCL